MDTESRLLVSLVLGVGMRGEWGTEEGKRRVTANGWGFLCGDENVLELDGGD